MKLTTGALFACCPHCRTDVQVLSRRDGAIVSRIGCGICRGSKGQAGPDPADPISNPNGWSAAERYEASHWSCDEPDRGDPDWPAYAASVGLEP